MPSEHARLSPSSSERWLSCPASVRMAETVPEQPDSPYAAEGTLAHSLLEIEGLREFGAIHDREYLTRHRAWLKEASALKQTSEQLEAMASHIADCLEMIHERLALYPHSQVLFEQRMDSGVPTCWGTSDIVIVSPRHVEIIDLKYGQGVAVDATGNPQLRLYGLGALDMFGDVLGDTEVVRITVFQPRLNATSTEEISTDELRAWRDSILPIAESALGDDAPFGPSEEACRWCPVAGQCRPQLEWATSTDFSRDPDLLTPEEIAETLEKVGGIKAWCDQVSGRALALAYSEGTDIPGYKVVLSGVTRAILDEGAVRGAFTDLGIDEKLLLTEPKLVGLGALETLLKQVPKIKPEGASRERFMRLEDAVPTEALGHTPGKPALAPADDKRPAISPDSEAQREFSS